MKINKSGDVIEPTPKVKKEKYSTKEKKNSAIKQDANKLFTREASKNVGKALILDAETLITTSYLARRGFKNIIVPNPYVYDKIKKDKRIQAKNMLVGEYIANCSDRLTAVWLDYCGTFDGSESTGINPQEDIRNLFKKKLLTDNSTFAVTFSFRTQHRVAYPGESEDRVRKCIANEARINGYSVVPERKITYTGIYMILYRVYSQ